MKSNQTPEWNSIAASAQNRLWQRQLLRWIMAGALLLFFGLFLLLPIYTVAAEGLQWNMFVALWRNPLYREGICNALLMALVTTGIVFAIALPLALLYDRYDFPGKKLCNLAIMAPMILPPFVGALGFMQIFGYYGVLNTLLRRWGLPPVDLLSGEGKFFAVALIEAFHLYPILYLNLVAALGNVDPQLNAAARNLGVGIWRRTFQITLPLIRGGILSGGSLVLIWSFTELGTPLMFGLNRIAPVQVFNDLTELEGNALPYTLVVILMLFSALLYLGVRVLTRGGAAAATATKGASGGSAKVLHSWQKFLPGVWFGAITLLAILPHLALLLIAFGRDYYGTLLPDGFTLDHFRAALGDPLVLPSIVNSLQYSLGAMVLAVTAGTICALLIARWKLRGALLFDLLSMAPLAIPGIVMAFGMLAMTVKYRWCGMLFDPVNAPFTLLVAAYAIRRMPYVVRAVVSGLEQTPTILEDAARNLGISAWRIGVKIVLPLIAANLLIGGLFAFSFSMLEVSDSLILVQRSAFYPITKAIFELSQILGAGPVIASAFGVWTMAFMAATLGAATALLGRRLGALFRF